MQLKLVNTIEINPTAPFNFDATFFKPDHFTTDDHVYLKGIRWQTWNFFNKPLGLKFESCGSVNKPKVKLSIWALKNLRQGEVDELVNEICFRYNLNLDIAEFYKFAKKFKILRLPIKNLYGMRPGHPSSLYEYLIIGIILQNASVKRSIQMFKNLLSKYGKIVRFDNKKLLCFWNVGRFKNVSEDELRVLKVGYRAKSIKKIDEQFESRKINEKEMRLLDSQSQKRALLNLYGVGPATVWYLLFDVFHRWEVFEHISPWEQKIYSRMFFNKELVPVEKLLRFINQFGKFKHLAVHYLWEDLWWKRFKGKKIEWLEKEIRS